jgi:hypothetical protein
MRTYIDNVSERDDAENILIEVGGDSIEIL